MDAAALFAQSYSYTTKTAEDGASASGLLLVAALVLVGAISLWRVFEKAKQPGWASLIPIYNTYVLLKIVGRPGWWLLLYLIPFVNLIVHIIVAVDSAKAFGKSTTFGVVGLWLFSFIGYMILGFGDAKYKGVPKH